METDDLRVFAAVARGATLAQAAEELHLTVSALSKAIRRLEAHVDAPLFDRVGARLRLNDAGRRLLPWAQDLVDRAKAARRAVRSDASAVPLVVAGPAILQWRWAGELHDRIRQHAPRSELRLRAVFEDVAVAELGSGHCDAALVTVDAMPDGPPAGCRMQSMGRFTSRLASSNPQQPGMPIACTSVSPLCGLPRRAQSATWHLEQGLSQPLIRVDDVLVLVQLVREGRAMAYLPDFLIEASGLSVADAPSLSESEDVVLVMRDGAAAALGIG